MPNLLIPRRHHPNPMLSSKDYNKYTASTEAERGDSLQSKLWGIIFDSRESILLFCFVSLCLSGRHEIATPQLHFALSSMNWINTYN